MHISLDSALGRQRRLNQVGETISSIAAPTAAYSLRSLTGGDPKVVRVRRESDNHEQNFTASEVSSGALVDFVNAQVTAPLDIRALTSTGRDGDFLIAKAAYSLRSLGTRQATVTTSGDTDGDTSGKFVCQVRRSSDDVLKSFTADEITDGTLLAFTNADYAKYTSDFSAGDNSWGSLDDVTETGNIDGIGGLDDNLRLAIGSATSQHRAFRSGILPVSQKINFSARVFIPSTNSVVDSFRIADASGTAIIAPTTPAQDQWVTVTASNVTPTNSSGQLRVFLQDGETNSFTGNGSDVIYLREIVVTQVTSDGLVRTWYDQSVTAGDKSIPTGNHATQATAANQPKIVSAGSLVVDSSGVPELEFDGSDDVLSAGTGFASSSKTIFCVNNPDSLSSNGLFAFGSSQTDRFFAQYTSNLIRTEINGAQAGVSASTQKNLITNLHTTDISVGLNGGSFTTTSASFSGVSASAELKIGQRFGTAFVDNFDGTIQEFIVYDTDQSDNRTAIEANMGEHYSISGIPAFDNSVNGFVETWYDQSGNGNDATQATAGSQPKIVNAGSLLTAGVTFDGSNDNMDTSHVLGATSTIFAVCLSSAVSDFLLDMRDSGTDGAFIRSAANDSFEVRYNSTDLAGASGASGQKLGSFLIKDGTQEIRVNGTSVGSGTTSGTISVTATTQIGGRSFATPLSGLWLGSMSEIIIYNSDQSANRPAIETNINNHYSIF